MSNSDLSTLLSAASFWQNSNSNVWIDLGEATSRLFGWIYFLAWSLSFYPQVIKTCRRRSVTGLSIDFFTINVVGFAVYTISTFLLLFSATIRAQYAARHPSAPKPNVQYNDLAFGIHAFTLAFIMWCQFWFFGFKRDPTQTLGTGMTGVIIGSTVAVTSTGALAYFKVDGWEALDVVYTLSYIKLLITVLKYIPQAYLNYQRKSTVGWSIHNILLDTTGGVLSLAQLFLDSALAGDLWGGTSGNPLKLGLGLITLGFDGIFMAQHYVWFRHRKEEGLSTEREPLAGADPDRDIERVSESAYGST
ncbi:PQ loop repeat-domain-containing protein [Kalaharituber pfeilii]|nr:PQ loop repeat-domain-containing protein [Kalaharituber pfeilii]